MVFYNKVFVKNISKNKKLKMNETKNLKEKQINDYISTLLLNENSIDTNQIKKHLGIILGEKPGIDLEYKTEELIIEDGKQSIKNKKLESINVYYSYYDDSGLRFGTLKYLTD